MAKRSDFKNKLVAVVLPIAFQQFMLAAVSASDAIMLGISDQNALSAVSLAGQVSFVENLFLAAMTIGFSMFAAQYWGKGDGESVEKLFNYVLKISAAVSGVFFVVTLTVPELSMRIFTTEPLLVEYGAKYLRIVSPSYLLTGVSQIYLSVLKNTDRAAKANVISSFCVVLNIALNAVLIFGKLNMPKMGISGAAVATVVSKVVESVWAVVSVSRKGAVRPKIAFWGDKNPEIGRKFWKYTLPVLGNEAVWGLGMAAFSAIFGRLGKDAVAANSVAAIVKNLAACFCLGLAGGSGIIVGNELGAGQTERAEEYGKKLLQIAVVSGLVSGLAVVAVIPAIKFSDADLTAQAKEYLVKMLIVCGFYMVGKSVNATLVSGVFCAGGDSRFGLKCDAVSLWCGIIPAAMLAAFVFKADIITVYVIISLDEAVKVPFVLKHYKKRLWVNDLTTDGKEG